MSYLRKLASSISKGLGGRRTTLAITDLTHMWDDVVCIASVDEEGPCIRPVRDGGVRRAHLFRDGRPAVYPRARVRLGLAATEIDNGS